jgi:hypothetical protein
MKKILFLLLLLVIQQQLNYAQQSLNKKTQIDNLEGTNNPIFQSEIGYSSFYNFDADSMWYVFPGIDSLVVYFYHEKGVNSYIRKAWDYYNERWIIFDKFEHYIDPNLPFPKLSDYLFEEISGGYHYGVNYTMTYFNYSGDSISIKYIWDTISMDWEKKFKLERFISSDGIDTLTKGYNWDTTNNQWKYNFYIKNRPNSLKADTIFKTEHLVELTDTLDFDILLNFYDKKSRLQKKVNVSVDWDGSYTDSIVYDNQDRYQFIYGKSSDDSVYVYLEEYLYDSLGRTDSILSWNIENGYEEKTFEAYIKYFYPEQNIISSRKTISNSHYFFPNPANESIQIPDYSGDIKIINLSGQVLIESKVQQNEVVDISLLKPGCYILQFENKKSELLIKE